ncbi:MULTISPECIES: GNAT family N-acetyltransferase [unclassified Streptomyces]|uniref:GNAT family N-acetyltransferase n=1 Tax=Streptomyces evansiae TaxID=3075535 RepID=A0ABD5E5N7_9ACTN|nr:MULTISPECIES: GNAT family N-acetyltransferase [unclassified Streptomyces]ASY35826.1 N-acetyltransferase [Streptomyces sp. CLI2509]MDT0410525.1 GNAT family N-acetyltransferase [Streptomyces sp. DSM 41979]MDT0415605.1 GNAT family N-acetyltransferase [Streptomyces sp. DSM 41982]MDT0420581.1 GNAT family N-acetyltransferase [Streptomyces sp. DSM 41859]MYQ56733.1 GNAT family N-acetyltransferase [Streptomyces sp. SID4926]
MTTYTDLPAVPLPPGHFVSDAPDLVDVERVHHWLSTDAYWALGRSLEKQRAAVAASLNFGVYEEVPDADGTVRREQRAYARVVTDRATFAWLCDVYVPHEARGRGLAKALLAAVRARMEEYGVRRVLLVTSSAQELYRSVGYAEVEPGKWMILPLE